MQDVIEFHKTLTDLTEKMWVRENKELKRGGRWRFDWKHPDSPEGHSPLDGTFVVFDAHTRVVDVQGETGELYAQVPEFEWDDTLNLYVDYAQMACDPKGYFPDAHKRANMSHAKALVSALVAIGAKDASFTGGNDGVTAWFGSDFLLEYDLETYAYTLWSNGMYWVSSSIGAFVLTYEKAKNSVRMKLQETDK